MYPPGHVGIALALYAPIGLLVLLLGRTRLAVAGTVVVAGATLLPDVDKWLPWFVHRGLTHTVWFALAVGVTLGALVAIVAVARHRSAATVLGVGAFGVLVGALAVVAHLLGDVITPMDVRPFAPLSGASYTFSLVFASDPTANARLLTLGYLATVAQLGLGVGLAPGTSGRSTIEDAVSTARRYVPTGLHDVREATHGHSEDSTRRVRSTRSVREVDD